jgi:hypothetical protein
MTVTVLQVATWPRRLRAESPTLRCHRTLSHLEGAVRVARPARGGGSAGSSESARLSRDADSASESVGVPVPSESESESKPAHDELKEPALTGRLTSASARLGLGVSGYASGEKFGVAAVPPLARQPEWTQSRWQQPRLRVRTVTSGCQCSDRRTGPGARGPSRSCH